MNKISTVSTSYLIGGVVATSLVVTALVISKKDPEKDNVKCKEFVEKCAVNTDCCDSYSCIKQMCLSKNIKPDIDAFLLCTMSSTVKKYNNLFKKYPLEEMTRDTKEFWRWNNDSLAYLVFNDLGNATTFYISDSVVSGYAASSTTKTNIILADNNTIYNSTYTMCLDFDDQGLLVWRTFDTDTKPSSFLIVTDNKECKTQCLTNSDCCAPYGNCLNKQCVTCKGDPEEIKLNKCPSIDMYLECGNNNEWSCKSKCTNIVQCGQTEEVLCSENTDETWTNKCVLSCNVDEKPICNGLIKKPVCKLVDNKPEWECPFHPCDGPTPDTSLAPIPVGYILSESNGDVIYTNLDNPDSYALYPVWNCFTQYWEYDHVCNPKYKLSCNGVSSGICGSETAYSWKCVDSTQTELCGLNTNDCGQDAKCIDVNSCDGNSEKEINTWKWVCPDGEPTLCETIKYKELNVMTVNYDNTPIGIYIKEEKPVYPTIDNKKCRSANATYIGYPDMHTLINNKAGNIVGEGTELNPYVIPVMKENSLLDGTEQYIVSNVSSDDDEYIWSCLSKNPCKNGGKYVKNDGSTYDPNHNYTDINGEGEPPTEDELFANGKCLCAEGFTGTNCYPDCTGNGVYNIETNKCECINYSTVIFPGEQHFNLFNRTGDRCETYEDKSTVENYIVSIQSPLNSEMIDKIHTCNYGERTNINRIPYNIDIDLYTLSPTKQCVLNTKYVSNNTSPFQVGTYPAFEGLNINVDISTGIEKFIIGVNGHYRLINSSNKSGYYLPSMDIPNSIFYNLEYNQDDSDNVSKLCRYNINIENTLVYVRDIYSNMFLTSNGSTSIEIASFGQAVV